jgi:hypothetical protein
MGEEGQSRLRGVSKREIAAAWACCGLVMLGVLIADSGGRGGDPATAVYAGAHIPGGAVRSVREADAEQDLEHNRPAEIGNFANLPVPVASASVELLTELLTASESARARKAASGYCRYAFDYSAAARLAAAAGSGVREAAQ